MKNRRIFQLHTHIGVTINHQGLTGINAEKHKVVMSLHPMGVQITPPNGELDLLVPYSNVQYVRLYPEEAEVKSAEPKTKKVRAGVSEGPERH